MTPWADILYACDASWWQLHYPEVSRNFHGEKWTVDARSRDRFDLMWIYGIDAPGLSKRDDLIHTGKNSGHQAVSLAAHFGASKIFLLGFDFQLSGNKRHWHGDHPKGLGNGGHYHDWVRHMGPLAKDLKAAGVEVINCSRKTAINCFPRKSIEEALDGLERDPSRSGHAGSGDTRGALAGVCAPDLAGCAAG